METTVLTSLELGCKSLYKETFSPLKLSFTFFTTLVLNNTKLGHSFISSITINITVNAIGSEPASADLVLLHFTLLWYTTPAFTTTFAIYIDFVIIVSSHPSLRLPWSNIRYIYCQKSTNLLLPVRYAGQQKIGICHL